MNKRKNKVTWQLSDAQSEALERCALDRLEHVLVTKRSLSDSVRVAESVPQSTVLDVTCNSSDSSKFSKLRE